MKKKTKEQKLIEKIKKIYEKYPEPNSGLKNWNKGGFINDEKYKQPVKRKTF